MKASNTLTMTKLQSDYAPHNADDLVEGWNAVSTYVENCVLIAFDGCHKIYLAMDEAEARLLKDEYEYEFTVANDGETNLMSTLDDWYASSCDLKFIQAVWNNEADPNAGFVDLISQEANWAEYKEENEDSE